MRLEELIIELTNITEDITISQMSSARCTCCTDALAMRRERNAMKLERQVIVDAIRAYKAYKYNNRE